MKKSIILSLVLALASTASFAQTPAPADSTAKDTTWTHGGNFSLSISQISLSNWAAGGESALSANSELNLFLNMVKEKQTWENELQLGLGYIREGGGEATFKKNNDLIILTSNYGRRFNKRWNATANLDFRTQMAQGFAYTEDSLGNEVATQTSGFMAPAYLLTAIGVNYSYQKMFSVNLAPATSKLTFVLDPALAGMGLYGVPVGQNVRSEFGYSVTAKFKKQFTENINFRTSVLMFSDYEGLGVMDVNWEAFLRFKINKYLSSSISTQLIWDKDIQIPLGDGTVGSAVQFRSVLNIGLAVDFWDK